MRPEPLNILVGIILQPGDQGTRTKKVDPEGTQGPRGRQTSAGTKQGQRSTEPQSQRPWKSHRHE